MVAGGWKSTSIGTLKWENGNMKKLLCVVTLLACVASANAYVELFLVPDDGTHGIGAPNTFNMNEINFLPDFLGTSNAPGPVGPIDTTGGSAPLSTYFVYAKFVGEEAYATIYGVNTSASWSSGVGVGQNLIYRHRKTNGTPSQRWDRWDGDQPIPLVNGTAVAVTADGINFAQPGDGSFDIYTDANGTALLGAVEVGADQNTAGSFKLGIGSQGLVINDGIHTDPTKTYFPEVRFNGQRVQGEQYTTKGSPDVFGEADGIVFTPEPASLLLIGLAGLMIRRR